MYDYRCKSCENLGQCMPMMNMPMYENQMLECDEDNEDLKIMYPKVYIKMYQMVKHHYDIMVAKYGRMYCPSEEEMDHMVKEICDRYKEHNKRDIGDEDDYCDEANMRQRGGYGTGLGDLARILIIGSLIGGRDYFGW